MKETIPLTAIALIVTLVGAYTAFTFSAYVLLGFGASWPRPSGCWARS